MALGMNYSTAGFELILSRKMSFYIITYYLPSGLFVGISWVSFLINPEVIPGRMTMLVTLFLVLINIHNTIQTNSPKVTILINLNLNKRYLTKITSYSDLISGRWIYSHQELGDCLHCFCIWCYAGVLRNTAPGQVGENEYKTTSPILSSINR